jgi:uncharacterized protein YndB with AHSA1/START domain
MTIENSGARVLGSLRRMPDGRGAVRVEDLYDTDIDNLWSAVTEPERLRNWIGEVTGDLTVGGAFHATFTSSWDGPGRVDVCERPHRLLLTMEPGTPHETVIEAVLTAEGDKTRLVVEERGLPAGSVHFHGAGWQAHIAYLAGKPRVPWKERWTELMPAYPALSS